MLHNKDIRIYGIIFLHIFDALDAITLNSPNHIFNLNKLYCASKL